jgi:hypothetical protein
MLSNGRQNVNGETVCLREVHGDELNTGLHKA